MNNQPFNGRRTLRILHTALRAMRLIRLTVIFQTGNKLKLAESMREMSNSWTLDQGGVYAYHSILKEMISTRQYLIHSLNNDLRAKCLQVSPTRWAGFLCHHSEKLRAERSGNRIPVETRLYAAVQTGPEAHQPPIQWVPGHSPGGKAAGVWR